MALFVALLVFSVCYGNFVEGYTKNTTDCKDWTLVFRGISGNGKSVYSAFYRTQPSKCTIQSGCLPNGTDPAFIKNSRNHLTSPLIKQWRSLTIVLVKLELYRYGKSVAHFVFSAHRSSSTSWFTLHNLLETNYHDLHSGACLRHFHYYGYNSIRFFIARDYGCAPKYEKYNNYWLAIVDSKHSSNYKTCKWAYNQSSFPAFLYAPYNVASKFSSRYRKADEMAIFIKTAKPIKY